MVDAPLPPGDAQAVNPLPQLYLAHLDSLAARTAGALAVAGYDALVIHSGSLAKRSVFDDQYWPLRLVPQFAHWAYLEWPESALIFRPGENAPRLLAMRDLSFWERHREPQWDILRGALDIVEVNTHEAIAQAVKGLGKVALVAENVARGVDWGIPEKDINPPALLTELDELRVHKTPYEIYCLTEANRRAALGHQAVKEAFFAGERSELRLHLRFLEATGQDDSETPYKNIVAVGANASILHHVHYQQQPGGAPSLLLDAAASYRGYASDITRTYVAPSGDAGQLFAGLVEQMEQLQQALVGQVKVGRPYESLHDEAHQRLSQVLVDAGLVRMSPEACLETGISRMFLPHGLGHSLGLTCHDVGCAKIRPRADNPWLRNTRTIEPEQVFTIEPGLYFIDTFMEQLKHGPHGNQIDWKKIQALAPYGGIRIEDDVVVLPDGDVTTSDNLTRAVLPN